MDFLLWLHSWLRWAVILFGIAAVIALLVRREGRPAARLSLFFVISLDLQLLLGLVLWAIGPYFRALLDAPGEVMGSGILRFWGVEHGFAMIVAVALAHVGRVAARRAATPESAGRRTVVFFVIALLIVLAATPWPGLAHARPLFRL